jgi:hypothetical protein
MKAFNTLLWSFFAAASEILFRRNKVMVWPARTLSASQSPFPALGIPDFLTSSPGNRRGSAYFLGWPGKGYKTNHGEAKLRALVQKSGLEGGHCARLPFKT